MKAVNIKPAKEAPIAISLDTIRRDKQALIFCARKRAAESQAEKISKSMTREKHIDYVTLKKISEEVLHVLSTPTKQCKRLAMCLEQGIAFHHAGLASKQRELIEDNFRSGVIKIICSTPTLAAGLDMPAFRTIIRDTKRFGTYGMTSIPVLEYEQMAGRAGRPGKEAYGEAIIVSGKESDVPHYFQTYIHGEVEDIFSKLAVEPVLRMYILSLVATEFIRTGEELETFFAKTFYAKQYGNTHKLNATLHRVTRMLMEWHMLTGDGESQDNTQTKKKEKQSESDMFISGSQLLAQEEEKTKSELKATLLGQRVSQIYIDPLSANIILTGLNIMHKHKTDATNENQTFALLHLLVCSLEMRPLLRVKTKEYEDYLHVMETQKLFLNEENYLETFSEDFIDTIKTTHCLIDWINEVNEEQLLEKYDVRPGELSVKIQKIDWLLYASEELARITKQQQLISIIKHVRERVKHGAKSELLTLLHFKGIGRVRARKLYNNNIKGVSDVKKTSYELLKGLVGKAVAGKLKEQVGESIKEKETTKTSSRGQQQLNSFE